GPHVREDALLIDVTSIKAAPISAMLTCSKASVVGTHPLFAPSVHSLQGQRVILCRGRGDAWFDWLSRMLHAAGLVIREASPQDHDRAMSIVQVLVHFSTEVMGRTLARLGVDIEETLAFTSPIYLMELLMTARHFAQSPELYASIEMSNPLTAEVTGAFVEAAGRWRETVTSNNRGAFIAGFDTVRAMFGDFTGRALSQSAYLIDRLVERE
ncbi:MAG: prephenate dehydrogenase/arogenate dehydrogenase family protein, partial [Phycisphaerae bacterium]